MKTAQIVSVIIIWAVIIFLTFFECEGANAAVTGMCSNCHTMHDSQGGVSEVPAIEGGSGSLTKGGCVGCHTGTNEAGGVIPFVFSTDKPIYGANTLAGGNFYWVTQDSDPYTHRKGHNVKGIPGMLKDPILSAAPGGVGTCGDTTGCHDSLFEIPTKDTGCEGCHLHPKHHATRQDKNTPAEEEHGYFRFLSGHFEATGQGVEGIEDKDWQLSNSETDHNEYLGVVNNNTTGGFCGVGGNTMTAYCTGCHGNFHVQESKETGGWIRHPSDSPLSTEECENYTVYDPNVPVARTALDGVSSKVDSNDLVMCLSCHRAHGSPYDDMLRWDYGAMVINNSANSSDGCFKCHSTK